VPRKRTLPNLENTSLDELEVAMRCTPGKIPYNRLLAMKSLILQIDFDTVAQIHSITTRTLQRWVADFNEFGVDGLLDSERTGRPRAIAPERADELTALALDPAKVGHAHWTGVKFHGHLRKELGIEVGYSTVIRFFHERNLALKVPQPWPDRQDEELRKAFCAQLEMLLSDDTVELWFGDETGIEGDPRPRRRWAVVGTNPRVTKNGDHLRMNVCGIVAPRTGETYLLEFTHSDGDTFQAFLDEANKDLPPGRPRQILVLDNASWHKVKGLRWGRFEPLFLPPYSPDLNPIEKLWRHMKAEWFTDFVAKDLNALIARIDVALNWAIDRAPENRNTCPIKTRL
jgi:transposase